MLEFIVYKSKIIEKIFAVIFIISAVCFPFVKINYDLSKYLPSEMESKQGIDLMEKEFGYPGTARIMISGVSIYEAKNYKSRIENIKGVESVTWADSFADIYQPDTFIQYKNIDDYYKNGNSVMDVIFTGNNSDVSTKKALNEIENMLGQKGAFSGPAVQEKFLNEVLAKEMIKILVFAVAIIFGILTLFSHSWFEPIVFLTVILISVVINMGTNIIFGNISSITFSIAAVLQLAVAMDYTIILLDNFTKERKYETNVEKALIHATQKSITTVFSAGAAAILGFLVLVLMRYGIGKDIGLVLAKGIAISLITVIFLTPAIILRTYKKIEKTQHKYIIPDFTGMASKINKFSVPIALILLILTVPSYFGRNMTDFTFGNDSMGLSKGTKLYEDDKKINSVFGRNNLVLLIVPNTSIVTEKKLSNELGKLPYVKNVTSFSTIVPQGIPESFLPKNISSKFHTKGYARILVPIKTANESELAFNAVKEIKAITKKYYPEKAYVVGATPSTMDIKSVIVDDWAKIEKLSLLGVAFAIMIAFKSLALPFVLVIPIMIAVFINMMIPYLQGEQIMFMGFIIVNCLQLGATIDYSIIMTYHYLEYRNKNDKKTASIKAAAESIPPILMSGFILSVAGFGVYFLSSVKAISDLGILIGRGAILSMIMVIVLLPSLFVWADGLILRSSITLPFNKKNS